jgi:putative ABC transport system substrate-binding protein
VFAAAGDPVGTGLVASLARPGGNITGLSIQQTDLASKRLEMLREVLPGLRTVAILANISSPNSVLEMAEAQAAARTVGLAVVTSEVRGVEDIAPAFDALRGRSRYFLRRFWVPRILPPPSRGSRSRLTLCL